ncbi:MAG TPA: hypothetical protein VGT61_09905 [Thermomicrobiales bacterium]|jgi:hypothetical protein|nr:hypothetical protein [Thermomicrobiales bacterium]
MSAPTIGCLENDPSSNSCLSTIRVLVEALDVNSIWLLFDASAA